MHIFYHNHCNIYSARKRSPIQISAEQQDYRDLLQKEWARYQRVEKLELNRICRNILQSQQNALDELRNESEELYQAAIQIDETLLPITFKGPVQTPPIKNYDSPAEYRFKRQKQKKSSRSEDEQIEHTHKKYQIQI